MRKVVKDQHVEVLQLLDEDLVDGKRNQAQLVFVHVHHVAGGAQEDERDQFQKRILLQREPQEPVVPRGRPRQGQHPDLVPAHLHPEGFPVVPGNILAPLFGKRQREAVGAQLPRRVVEGHAVLVGVTVDGDGVGGDEVPAEVEVERHLGAGHAVRLNREVDGDGAAAKGQFRGAQAGDAQVLEAVRLPHSDGEDRPGVARELVEGFGGVDDAVGHHDDPRGFGFTFGRLLQGVEEPAGVAVGGRVRKPRRIPRGGFTVEGVELEVVFSRQPTGQPRSREHLLGGVEPADADAAGGELHALGGIHQHHQRAP